MKKEKKNKKKNGIEQNTQPKNLDEYLEEYYQLNYEDMVCVFSLSPPFCVFCVISEVGVFL